MTTTAAERKRVYPDVDQFVVRAMVVVGSMTAVVAAQAAGARPAGWEQYVVLGLALLTAFRPESTAGFGLLAGSAYVWALAPETLSPLVLLAVAGMILAHVAALLAAQGPAWMRLDRVQVRRWAGRAVLLWLTAAVVWGLTVVLAELPPRRWVYALGLTLTVVVVVAATRMIGSRDRREGR
jgi:hypothetical protein